MDFVGNLLLFRAVKEFWKSIKNWQSYRSIPWIWCAPFLGHCVQGPELWERHCNANCCQISTFQTQWQ